MADRERLPGLEIPIPIKFYDLDLLGIVHNAVYIRWLEDLRSKLMEDIYPLPEQYKDNILPALEHTEITYKQALRMGDEPSGRIWVTRLTRVRWEVKSEFCLAGEVVAFARQSGFFVDLKTLRPIRIPQPLREWWAAQQERPAQDP